MSRFAVIVLIAVVVTTGCARLTGMGDESSSGAATQKQFFEAQALAKSGKFAEATDAFKEVAQSPQGGEWAAKALYEYAMVYLAADNPQRDYSMALAKLDEFISQHPSNERAPDARNWRQAIKTLLDLKKENDRLNKNIERLKQLDMRQEEKRMGR